MGTPRAFWTNDDYVWELQNWYKGRALAGIVADEQKLITGPRLFAVVEAVVKVLDYVRATSLIGQTTLRSILGQSDLDHLLSERDKINAELQQVIDTQTSAWGVKVTSVEVRDLELPQTMQRAMARQAEAEREKRAKVIHAEGEFIASQQLANAAAVIGSQPATLQLRYLQTLTEIAAEKNSTIVFPLPLDLLQGFLKLPAPAPADVNGNVPYVPTPS